jgi:enoyl-CoA hydratase/carnithine racemase
MTGAESNFTEVEVQDGIAVLRLNHGVTNPINLELVNELSSQLEKLKADDSVNALVITSSNDKFFSIGFNLPELIALDLDEVNKFFSAFNQLSLDIYSYPKPTVAAITGHAIAGGCILAICFDHRFISEGKKLMGLNEVKLGLPVPYPADRIVTQLVGDQLALEIMGTGEFYPPHGSLIMGLVDQVLPLENVLPEALERAKLLGDMPKQAFQFIKHNRVEKIVNEIQVRLDEKQQQFVDCWTDSSTQELLKEASKKF